MFENMQPPAGGFGSGDDGFDDLDSFGGSYTPQVSFRPGIDTLSNGDYDFEVTDAALDRAKNNDRIIKLGLRTSAGRAVEHTYWLNKQEAVNRFGADMAVLEFPTHTWGSKVPLSKAIPECVAKLKGMRFRATKSSRQGTGAYAGNTYHDLYISSRIRGAVTPPTAATPAAHQPNGAQAQPAAAGGDDKIPF